MKELFAIQQAIKAPKTEFNKFGNFDYRTAEGILSALKPLLESTQCFVTLSDELVMQGTRYYIKSTVILTNSEGKTVQATGYAREAETKKGMDESQITGSCSSYARKYALCGLFAIDDGNDADNNAFAGKELTLEERFLKVDPSRVTDPRTKKECTVMYERIQRKEKINQADLQALLDVIEIVF